MLRAFFGFFHQIWADIKDVMRSRYTYIVLGLLAYVLLLQAVYLAAGWSYNGWLLGRNSLSCSVPSNGKILVAMFGSMLFAVFALRGFGEAVRAMDFHYKNVLKAEYFEAKKSAMVFLAVAGVLGMVLVWDVASIC